MIMSNRENDQMLSMSLENCVFTLLETKYKLYFFDEY